MKPHEEGLGDLDICVMALLTQISEKEVIKIEDELHKIHWHSVMVILNHHVPQKLIFGNLDLFLK
jgi:hypothetical protein